MRIRTRLLALVIGQLVLVVTVLLGLYLYTVSSKAHAQSVEKARSVIDLAEAVRDNMAEKWKLGVYQQEQLKEWAHSGNLDQVLATVPIVSAWQAVEDGAKKGGFEFKTPAERARNRANVADLVESEVLSKFRADKDLKEVVIPAPEKNAIRYFRPIRLTNDCLRCHGDPKTSEELWGNKEGFDATGTMMEGWKEGELHGAFEVTLSMEPAMVEARNEVLAGSAIVIALCTALAFAFSWVLHRQVTQPILDILTRLTARADQLKSASRLLNSTATQLTADAEECRSRSTTVAAAAEEMSVSVEQMAVSSEKLSDNVDTVDKAIMQLKSLASDAHSGVEEALRITGQAVTLTRESTEQIKSLGTAASEIDLVSKMIGDIAGQTNLLALNATIEAARAGTQGQGFAVVANEVKTLAQQTAKATQDIRRRIDAIQTATRTAVGSIQEVEEVINKVDSASQAIANTFEHQCQATEAIAQSVADANNYARALRQNTLESATATREVTSSIAVVDTRAQQNWSNARRTRQEGESLESIAGEIERMTLSLKI